MPPWLPLFQRSSSAPSVLLTRYHRYERLPSRTTLTDENGSGSRNLYLWFTVIVSFGFMIHFQYSSKEVQPGSTPSINDDSVLTFTPLTTSPPIYPDGLLHNVFDADSILYSTSTSGGRESIVGITTSTVEVTLSSPNAFEGEHDVQEDEYASNSNIEGSASSSLSLLSYSATSDYHYRSDTHVSSIDVSSKKILQRSSSESETANGQKFSSSSFSKSTLRSAETMKFDSGSTEVSSSHIDSHSDREFTATGAVYDVSSRASNVIPGISSSQWEKIIAQSNSVTPSSSFTGSIGPGNKIAVSNVEALNTSENISSSVESSSSQPHFSIVETYDTSNVNYYASTSSIEIVSSFDLSFTSAPDVSPTSTPIMNKTLSPTSIQTLIQSQVKTAVPSKYSELTNSVAQSTFSDLPSSYVQDSSYHEYSEKISHSFSDSISFIISSYSSIVSQDDDTDDYSSLQSSEPNLVDAEDSKYSSSVHSHSQNNQTNASTGVTVSISEAESVEAESPEAGNTSSAVTASSYANSLGSNVFSSIEDKDSSNSQTSPASSILSSSLVPFPKSNVSASTTNYSTLLSTTEPSVSVGPATIPLMNALSSAEYSNFSSIDSTDNSVTTLPPTTVQLNESQSSNLHTYSESSNVIVSSSAVDFGNSASSMSVISRLKDVTSSVVSAESALSWEETPRVTQNHSSSVSASDVLNSNTSVEESYEAILFNSDSTIHTLPPSDTAGISSHSRQKKCDCCSDELFRLAEPAEKNWAACPKRESIIFHKNGFVCVYNKYGDGCNRILVEGGKYSCLDA